MSGTLSTFISSVPTGMDPALALLFLLKGQFIPGRSHAVNIELWVLFFGSCLILILSIFSITVRYLNKVAWLFAKNSDGTIRPNAALTTQVCFMLYSAFHLIVLPTVFLTNTIPSNLAFIWQLISYTPLGFAFIFITWSTILAPTTSLSFLRLNSSRKLSLATRRTSRIISRIAIVTAVIFQASLIGPAVCTTNSRKKMVESGSELMLEIGLVIKNRTGIPGLLLLESTFDTFFIDTHELSKWYRISVGVYCSWTLCWVCLYVPSAIRLILTLRQRRHQLLRSVKSLQVLDDLVTNDDIELSKIQSFQTQTQTPSIAISISPPPSPKSPKKPRLSFQQSSHSILHKNTNGTNSKIRTLSSSSIELGSNRSTSPPLSSAITQQLSPSPTYRSISTLSSSSENTSPANSPSRPLPTHQQRANVITSTRSDQLIPSNSEIYQISEESDSTLNISNNGSSLSLGTFEARKKKKVPSALVFPATENKHSRGNGSLGGNSNGNSGTGGGSIHTVVGMGTALGTKLGYSRSQERLDELKITLSRTNRLLMTISIQFVLACVMAISYSTFGMVILSGRISHSALQNVYASWTGWTFVLPALTGTIIFTIMSLVGPRASFIPSSPKNHSSNYPSPYINLNVDDDFVPAETITASNHMDGKSKGSTEIGKKKPSSKKRGNFLDIDITSSTFTTTTSKSRNSTRMVDSMISSTISTIPSRERLTKSTSFFSLHSLFIPSSLDSASIDRKGTRAESIADFEESSNEKNKVRDVDWNDRNVGNQGWLPSDFIKEDSEKYNRDEEV